MRENNRELLLSKKGWNTVVKKLSIISCVMYVLSTLYVSFGGKRERNNG